MTRPSYEHIYRIRKADSFPKDRDPCERDFWAHPDAPQNRFNWEGEKVLYVSTDIKTTLLETGVRQREPFVLIQYTNTDPVLTALVASLSIGIPVRMTWHALMGLLNKAPSFETTLKLEKAVNSALSGLSLNKVYVRMVQPGRVPYVLIHILLKEDENTLTIASLDLLREKILKSVLKLHNPIVIDVLFTASQKFAEPTSGFSEV